LYFTRNHDFSQTTFSQLIKIYQLTINQWRQMHFVVGKARTTAAQSLNKQLLDDSCHAIQPGIRRLCRKKYLHFKFHEVSIIISVWYFSLAADWLQAFLFGSAYSQ